MLKDSHYYKEKYKKSSARILHLISMKSFGSRASFAQALGISRQRFDTFLAGKVPLNYASVIAGNCKFPTALLTYESYLLLLRETSSGYSELLDSTEYFTLSDKDYILKGLHIKDSSKYLKQKDKDTVKRQNDK